MNNPFARFIVRWFVCGLGLFIAASILGPDRIAYGDSFSVIVIAGLVLAIINTIIKPFVIILALPALLFSLGFFMIIINAAMVLLASQFYGGLDVNNFGAALVAGIVIGLLNYLVTALLEER